MDPQRNDRRRRPFLRAEWRHLALLNFRVDPALLRPFVPRGTELDPWAGEATVSLVGFLFLRSRLYGIPIPFHGAFEEVNLRFYVRREAHGESRRGVVFIREIVPSPAVAWLARRLYGENYVTLPMSHRLEPGTAGPAPASVRYAWRRGGRDGHLSLSLVGPPAAPEPGSEEAFVVEHYWGYSARRGGGTLEYRVDHVPWRVSQARQVELVGDLEGLYGEGLAESLSGPPASAFYAEGSPVVVHRGRPLDGDSAGP